MSPPVISDCASYQKPESGEGRRKPRPEPGLVGVVTARAVRIGVAGGQTWSIPILGWLTPTPPPLCRPGGLASPAGSHCLLAAAAGNAGWPLAASRLPPTYSVTKARAKGRGQALHV
jgi:hypothetical protein